LVTNREVNLEREFAQMFVSITGIQHPFR
jgi:hypothetical protein